MRITFTAVAFLCLVGCSATDEEPDHVALAKDAERSFHRACDAWAAAKATGQPTTQPAAEIHRSYAAFIKHVLKTKYIPNEAMIVPFDIASAGVLKSGEREMSYVAGGGQSGVVMSSFQRTEWTTDRVPGHGFLCLLGIEPKELRKSFKVTTGEWTDEGKTVLRLHYILDGQQGVIEARQREDGWAMYPDRGVVKPGRWWHPYADAAATRPAE